MDFEDAYSSSLADGEAATLLLATEQGTEDLCWRETSEAGSVVLEMTNMGPDSGSGGVIGREAPQGAEWR